MSPADVFEAEQQPLSYWRIVVAAVLALSKEARARNQGAFLADSEAHGFKPPSR